MYHSLPNIFCSIIVIINLIGSISTSVQTIGGIYEDKIDASNDPEKSQVSRVVKETKFNQKWKTIPSNLTQIQAQEGSTGVLNCSVDNLEDGSVSWVRLKDYVILTVGMQIYSSEDRYKVIHAEDSQDWALHIFSVTVEDSGIYECQISAKPIRSVFLNFTVVQAKAVISGGADKFIKPGSLLQITCHLVGSTQPPAYIFWYHFDRMINFDSNARFKFQTDRYSSQVIIQNAKKEDSGNYTCQPSNAKSASIYLHVLNDNNPAAMQHGSQSKAVSPGSYLILTFSTLLALIEVYSCLCGYLPISVMVNRKDQDLRNKI